MRFTGPAVPLIGNASAAPAATFSKGSLLRCHNCQTLNAPGGTLMEDGAVMGLAVAPIRSDEPASMSAARFAASVAASVRHDDPQARSKVTDRFARELMRRDPRYSYRAAVEEITRRPNFAERIRAERQRTA